MSSFAKLAKRLGKLSEKELVDQLGKNTVHFTTEKGSHLTPEMKEIKVRDTIKQLRKAGEDARVTKGQYIDASGKEYSEPSIMVIDPKDLKKIEEMAKATGQESILTNTGGIGNLQYTQDVFGGQGMMLPGVKVLSEKPKSGAFTEINTKDGKRFVVFGTEKVDPSAYDILGKYNTPEKATALRGAERQEYLNALDSIYGDKAKRMQAMGFSPDKYYHGTYRTPAYADEAIPFDEFEPTRRGSFFTKDPQFARGFAGTDNQVGTTYQTHLKNPDKFFDPSTPENALAITDDLYKDAIDSATTDRRRSNTYEALRSPRSNWMEVERTPIQNYIKDQNARGYKVNESSTPNVAVYNPEDIRSVNAAFDPRFKSSGKILAGGAAFGNPLDALVDLYNKFESGREAVTNKVADTVNAPFLSNPRIPEQSKQIIQDTSRTVTNTALDPMNLMGLGVADAAITTPLMYEELQKKLKGSK